MPFLFEQRGDDARKQGAELSANGGAVNIREAMSKSITTPYMTAIKEVLKRDKNELTSHQWQSSFHEMAQGKGLSTITNIRHRWAICPQPKASLKIQAEIQPINLEQLVMNNARQQPGEPTALLLSYFLLFWSCIPPPKFIKWSPKSLNRWGKLQKMETNQDSMFTESGSFSSGAKQCVFWIRSWKGVGSFVENDNITLLSFSMGTKPSTRTPGHVTWEAKETKQARNLVSNPEREEQKVPLNYLHLP